MKLIPVGYRKFKYPNGIQPRINEIAGHFDTLRIDSKGSISLHTEYSYGHREYSSPFLQGLDSIKSAERCSIPQLWFNNEWATEFGTYVLRLLSDTDDPIVIEIHPPFVDYCPTIEEFLLRFRLFEESIKSRYPDIEILLENRCGSLYKGGKFLISNTYEICVLAEMIIAKKLTLRIALDIPQIFSAEGDIPLLSKARIEAIIGSLLPSRHLIRGIHLWGKKRNDQRRRIAHQGNLNDYFEEIEKKEVFLSSLFALFNDDYRRYFVPEVNSNNADLESIISEMISGKAVFI